MQYRYYISNKWPKDLIVKAFDAFEFGAKFYKLKGVTTVKFINQDCNDATSEKIKNSRFEIRLNLAKVSDENHLLKCIFHELTHLKQFQQDGLDAKLISKSLEEYLLSKWEIEARGMEDALVYLFNKAN